MALHIKLASMIKDAQKRLLNEGKLYSPEKLGIYYATFRERFGPEVLRNLDGEALLTTMHGLDRNNRNTLIYWLEFKNDEELPSTKLGSISGGSALKYGVYQNGKTGGWMGREDKSNIPVPISLDQAIETARIHREEILRGIALLEKLPTNASDEDYRLLQAGMDEQLPRISGTAWGHKYFSLLYPEKLDDYHMPNFQRFHLVRLLQPNIPEGTGRYIAAGRFVAIGRELDMPLNHLTTILNMNNGDTGRPYRYWKLLATHPEDSQQRNWNMLRDGQYIALSWNELGDLSELVHTQESREKIKALMREHYQDRGRWGQEVFNFVTTIEEGDIVLAFEGADRKVVGIGKVRSQYYYEPSSHASHRREVEWLAMDEWELPEDEGTGSVVRELRLYANQVAVERHLVEASPQVQTNIQKVPLVSVPSNSQLRLNGISGRIQSILERKGQVILYGPPGTGKTYWAEATVCELAARQVYGLSFSELNNVQQLQVFGKSDSYVQLCSFHPAYGYEDFLEGFRPETKNDQMSFVRKNGIFKQLCDLARKDSNCNYYLIIDEINRGDVPRIFGELLTVLEKDKRGKSILLPLSGESFNVPQNVFVIGTMNTADRSIALLDTALRRRFGFVELLPEYSHLDTVIEGIPLGAWLVELNKRILLHVGRDARNLQVGHAYLLESGKPISDFAKFSRVIREDIIPLLEEYCYEDYNALKQILGATLVDEENQVIRHELFELGRKTELVQAFLEPTPDLTTLTAATDAEKELEASENADDLSDTEDQK